MVAHTSYHPVSQVFAYQVEIGFTLPVNQISRVKYIIHMIFGPCQRVSQSFLLSASKCLGTFLAQGLFLLSLVRIGCCKVCVGDVQNREWFF